MPRSQEDRRFLSQKPIPWRERLIFALDVSTDHDAKSLVHQLGDSVHFYKLGLELFLAGNYIKLIDWLRGQGKQVFADLKLFDVPQTVASAVKQLVGRGILFTSAHGNDAILEAAVQARSPDDDLKILAVTALTSLDQMDIETLGFKTDTQSLVLSRAKRALKIGCDGIISSGLETKLLREEYGEGFLVVVPGIRPVENRPVDDQKRQVDVEEAFLNGADYIVVGRPIKNAQDRRKAAEDIQDRIGALFAP